MKKKIYTPNIVRGGIAIPLGDNYYYMKGRKHKTGGIDIGKNPRTGIEVEDGEVMHLNKNEIKVFSAQPFLSGQSPAQRIMNGENPTKVFNAQERYKNINRLNDDGTKKKMGGLNRKQDYKSKSKPYPKVNSKNFAGKKRSYPIPTKDDAVDALRLAGLHGRNDIKEKVYNKYPELRKKYSNGGIYSVTSKGKTKLYPSFINTNDIVYNENIRKKAFNGIKIDKENLLNNMDDYIGLTSNVISGIIGRNSNDYALSKLKYNSQPVAYKSNKLKTRININPQINNLKETLDNYEKSIDANTASSNVALARKQRARNLTNNEINKLYANKENIETELLNKDLMNQQNINNLNVDKYNNWVDGKINFERNGEGITLLE